MQAVKNKQKPQNTTLQTEDIHLNDHQLITGQNSVLRKYKY